MPRVAVICKTLLKGGAEKQALILAKSLQERDIDVCFVNWFKSEADPENIGFIKENAISYYPMTGGFMTKLLKVVKILRKEKITVILSYLTQANFVAGICKILNKKIIAIGGIRNERLPYLKLLSEKIIHNHLNDFTIFNNYSAREKFMEKGFKPEKILVIQNAIDLYNTPDDEKITRNGEIKIVSVGRFVRQKDYSTALRSFRLLLDRVRDKKYQYLIVGYGPLEGEIRSLAEKLKITSHLKILINPPDISDILKGSDIFLSTSLFEGVSNSIMEAMASGLPVVATRVGDNNYLVKDGYNGFLVPCKEVESVAEKLEFLSESERRRREFGKNSMAIIENEFSRAKFTDKYLGLFSELHV